MRYRCIAFVNGHRCLHRAVKRLGDLCCCGRHGRITLLLMDDRLSPRTRMMLARSRWESVAEGQRLIARMHGKEAA